MTIIEKIYRTFIETPIITTDSRNVPAGSLFFALKGDSFDGNQFALKAIESGASFAIVDDQTIEHPNCIKVENVLSTLQTLANIHRNALGIKIIAITGSNGKTTTKELLNAVLEKKFKTFATKGNLNNHIGVPITLLSLKPETEIAIVEMGANHPGEIGQLAEIAQPNYGIITNIGSAHLEGFGSFEGVIKTKGELYTNISKNNGKVFYNSSNPILANLVKQNHLENNSIEYGLNRYKLLVARSNNAFLKISLVDKSNEQVEISTNLVGEYNLENIFAAITVGLYFGIDIPLIKEAIENYKPANSRSQLITSKTNSIILDAYNANPTSMEASLRNFSTFDHPNKVAIIGEMKEMGSYSEAEHKKIVNLANTLKIQKIIFIGEEYRGIEPTNLHFNSTLELVEYLRNNPIQNAMILIKGSRAVKLESVVELL